MSRVSGKMKPSPKLITWFVQEFQPGLQGVARWQGIR